jgi:hypothetical protein
VLLRRAEFCRKLQAHLAIACLTCCKYSHSFRSQGRADLATCSGIRMAFDPKSRRTQSPVTSAR